MLLIHPKHDAERSWNKIDCSWYLKAIHEINLRKDTLQEIYKGLKVEEKDIPETIRNASEKSFHSIAYAVTVWDKVLDECGIGALLKKKEYRPREADAQTTFDFLLLARYHTLYALHKEMEASTDEVREKLSLLGEQVANVYQKAVSKKYAQDEQRKIGLNAMIIQWLDIRVCPYCGANRIDPRKNQRAASNLDHFFPKKNESKKFYGIFALSLFNLIPSCPSCNLIKATKLLSLSPYDEERSDQEISFEWRLNEETGIEKFMKKPIDALTGEGVEVLIKEKDSFQESTQIIGKPKYVHGYGDDAKKLGLAETVQKGTTVSVPFYSEVAAEELCFHYKNRNVRQLRQDFPGLNIGTAHLKASRYLPEHYLQYQNAKLYHDLYLQLMKN